MLTNEKKSSIFRYTIIIVSVLLFAIIADNFYNVIISVTDENGYSEPPSTFYISRTFAINITDSTNKETSRIGNILPGNYILSVNGIKLINSSDISKILGKGFHKYVNFVIFDPFKNRVIRGGTEVSNLPPDFIRKLKSGAMIIAVEKDGASDRAGIKVGDVIIAINGKEFCDIYEADRLLKKQSSGSIINYKILSGYSEKDVKVLLAKIGVPFTFIIMLFNGLIFFSFGIFLTVGRPYIIAARLTGLMFLAFGYILASSGAVTMVYGALAPVKNFLQIFCGFVAVPLFIHSIMYFPKELPELIKRKWTWRIPYIIGFVGSVVFLVPVYTKMLKPDNLVLLITWSVLLCYFFILLFIFRNKLNKENKTIAKPVIISGTILVCLFMMLPIIRFAAPIFPFYIKNMQPILQLSIILLIIAPLTYLYVISKYRLLDLNLRIRRNIQYVFVTLLWQILSIGIIGIFIWLISSMTLALPNLHLTGSSVEVLQNPLNPEKQAFYEKMLFILISVISVVILWKFRIIVQHVLAKKFHRFQYDYRKVSIEFSEILGKNLEISELSKDIVRELGDIVHLKKIGIVVFKNEEKIIEKACFVNDKDIITEFHCCNANELLKSIRQFRGEFRTEYLTDNLLQEMINERVSYIIPVKSKTKIIGALLVGEKKSEVAHRQEDLEFLTSIAGQISVALDNALLYEDLAQQERIKHELSIARKIQLASLPSSVPDVVGLDISGVSEPALEVGGDFYDYLNGSENEVTVIVGDVSGKGTSAALYMSRVQGIIRTLHTFDLFPRKLLISTNNLLYKYIEKSYYITAFGARFDTKSMKVTFARAGHLPLYYYSAHSSKIERIVTKGIVLGFTKDSLFDRNLEEYEFDIHSGDVFLFVTDGITEARNSTIQDYGEERLMKIFKDNISGSAEGIKNSILQSVSDFAGDVEQFDDITAVVVKIK